MKRPQSSTSYSSAKYQKVDKATTLQTQKSLQLYCKSAKEQNRVKLYKKIKYQGIIYERGKFVELFHLGNPLSPYVAKIVNFIQVMKNSDDSGEEEFEPGIPIVQVEWYLRKTQICEKKNEKHMKNISNNDVFKSNQIFYLPVEAIINKIQVLTFDEYVCIGYVENSIYLSRWQYNIKTKLIVPDLDIIEAKDKHCTCKTPYNPDLEYIECQNCQKWFHNECVYRLVAVDQKFVCSNCQKTQNKKSKKKPIN